MEKKKKIKNWIKKHKTELLIAGVSASTIFMLVLGIKNIDKLEEVFSSLKNSVGKKGNNIDEEVVKCVSETISVQENLVNNIVILDKIPHDVESHLRNLPDGWHASVEKIATAAEHGYELLPGQTWVESYKTGGVAA